MQISVIQQQVKIQPRTTVKTTVGGLLLSLKGSDEDEASLIIGAPGLPNLSRILKFGDAVLYETPHAGMIEVRAVATKFAGAELLVTKVSPRLGLTAGLDSSDSENSPLLADEIERIKVDLQTIVPTLQARSDVSPEQLELVQRKLDEIVAASCRLGRKDWLMFVAGTLTNVVVGAAFAPEAAKTLFVATSQSLGWLFQNALRLVS